MNMWGKTTEKWVPHRGKMVKVARRRDAKMLDILLSPPSAPAALSKYSLNIAASQPAAHRQPRLVAREGLGTLAQLLLELHHLHRRTSSSSRELAAPMIFL